MFNNGKHILISYYTYQGHIITETNGLRKITFFWSWWQHLTACQIFSHKFFIFFNQHSCSCGSLSFVEMFALRQFLCSKSQLSTSGYCILWLFCIIKRVYKKLLSAFFHFFMFAFSHFCIFSLKNIHSF